MTIKKMKEESENLKIKFEVEKTQAAVKVLQEENYAKVRSRLLQNTENSS